MDFLNFKSFSFIAILFLGLVLTTSCNGGDDECKTEDLTYTNFGKSFLNGNCASSGCHDSDALPAVGKMDNYENAKTFIDFGRIKGAINHLEGFSNMPKGGDKLSDCNISKLEAWVDAGAPE
ncbi:MAG: hypothetical protein V3V14_00820 [Saprospiraceae bacterium]